MIVLGGQTRRHLASLSPALDSWRSVTSFADLDRHGLAVVEGVMIDDAPPFGVVNIVHPSGTTMGGNQKKRAFRGKTSLEAEALMVRETLGRCWLLPRVAFSSLACDYRAEVDNA